MNTEPIGILDSGVGGLTVLSVIISELPYESIVYIGDSQNTPYGNKSAEDIYILSKRLIEFLLEKQVKLIVIACNTITVSCLEKLRSKYPQIPIVGTVPVIKTASEVSQSKRIGILSTTRTAESDIQKDLMQKYAEHCQVFNYGTDDLVPLIEQNELDGEVMTNSLKHVLSPFQKEHIDTLVLGCTHFPFLRESMQHILGAKVQLLDSGGAIARQVKRVLQNNGNLSQQNDSSIRIYTTGNMNFVKKLAARTIKKKQIAFRKIELNI